MLVVHYTTPAIKTNSYFTNQGNNLNECNKEKRIGSNF